MNKPYYQEPNATVYCGHVLDVLRELPAESSDCIITSPPYWGLRSYKTEPVIWGDNHCEHEWGDVQIKTIAISDKRATMHTERDLLMNGIKVNSGNFCLKCHAWKGELGLEPTIELYISHLLQIFDEVKRVLKKSGTCWVNMGDSYYGGGFGHERDLSAEEFAKKYPKQGSNAGTCMDWQERKMVGDTKRGNLLPAKSLCSIPERFSIEMTNGNWVLRDDLTDGEREYVIGELVKRKII